MCSVEDAVDMIPAVLSAIVEVENQEVKFVKGYAKVEMVESTYAEVIVRHVGAPSASKSSITWFVHDAPVYSAASPEDPVSTSADVS
jgi:hypothetical protein